MLKSEVEEKYRRKLDEYVAVRIDGVLGFVTIETALHRLKERGIVFGDFFIDRTIDARYNEAIHATATILAQFPVYVKVKNGDRHDWESYFIPPFVQIEQEEPEHYGWSWTNKVVGCGYDGPLFECTADGVMYQLTWDKVKLNWQLRVGSPHDHSSDLKPLLNAEFERRHDMQKMLIYVEGIHKAFCSWCHALLNEGIELESEDETINTAWLWFYEGNTPQQFKTRAL